MNEPSRRRSINERAEEILQRNRKAPLQPQAKVEQRSEFELAYQDLMDGLLPKNDSHEAEDSPLKSFESAKSPLLADSFELSAADFEVGTIAAKKLKEKSADRGRRMSFDQEMYQSKDRMRQTTSPDLKVLLSELLPSHVIFS